MNTTTLNMTTLDGVVIIKKGGGGTAGGGGTSGVSVGDVTYYDYDGTVLHSYSADAFAALAEHPALPERAGLMCQGWNYDLTKAKAYVAKYGVLNIGATYITDDGKTRLYIKIAAEGRMDVPLYFSQTVANGVTIDWGDGSATETLSGTGTVNTTHKYTSIGDYCITLSVVGGCTLGLGGKSSSYCVMGISTTSNSVYLSMLKAVEIGNSVTSIDRYTFNNCYSLSSVVIPESVTIIGDGAFEYCYSLSSIVIPKSVTSTGGYAFSSCFSIASAIIPDGITSIGSNVFDDCYSLASVVIPESVTSIGRSAFSNCYGMAFYDFSKHTAIPTLGNTSAFTSIPSGCKIIVPDALYDEWIAATNWSAIASYIIKKSDWDALNA